MNIFFKHSNWPKNNFTKFFFQKNLSLHALEKQNPFDSSCSAPPIWMPHVKVQIVQSTTEQHFGYFVKFFALSLFSLSQSKNLNTPKFRFHYHTYIQYTNTTKSKNSSVSHAWPNTNSLRHINKHTRPNQHCFYFTFNFKAA